MIQMFEMEQTLTWDMWPQAAAGSSMAFTPAAMAWADSPDLRLPAARWVATREEEQAVLVGTQGPVKPKA